MIMKKKIWTFLAICFGISYAAAALFHFLGGSYDSPWGMLFASCYMLVPMVSVILTQLICKERVFSGCGISFKVDKWWFVAWLVMPVFCLLAMFASALIPGVELTTEGELLQQSLEKMPVGPWGVLGITVVSGLVAGATVNAVFAFGEEVAWRGFLHGCLADCSLLKKSLIIGFIWGIWHAPLILMGHNYPDHPVAGVGMMVLFCMLLTPVFIRFKEKSGSVMVAAIAHGTINACAGVSLVYLAGYNDLLCGPAGLAGLVVLLLSDIIVFAMKKPKR